MTNPAGVVADQHHVIEVKGGKELGNEAGDAGDGSVGAGPQRFAVRAERPGGDDAPQATVAETFS